MGVVWEFPRGAFRAFFSLAKHRTAPGTNLVVVTKVVVAHTSFLHRRKQQTFAGRTHSTSNKQQITMRFSSSFGMLLFGVTTLMMFVPAVATVPPVMSNNAPSIIIPQTPSNSNARHLPTSTNNGPVMSSTVAYPESTNKRRQYKPQLRARRLPGSYEGFDIDFDSEEAEMAVGFLLFIVLALLLCCCCCGGGGRRYGGGGGGCGLWDIVACLCIWEMCCDRDGGAFNDFNMM